MVVATRFSLTNTGVTLVAPHPCRNKSYLQSQFHCCETCVLIVFNQNLLEFRALDVILTLNLVSKLLIYQRHLLFCIFLYIWFLFMMVCLILCEAQHTFLPFRLPDVIFKNGMLGPNKKMLLWADQSCYSDLLNRRAARLN